MKRKILMIIAAVLIVIFAAVLIVCEVILPVTYDIDESLITPDESCRLSVSKKDGYTSIVKLDENGNPSDEPINVIAFTDVHLDAKKEKGDVTLSYIVRNIVRERPDLVIFLGDTITGPFNSQRLRQFCEIMEELNVYWAPVLGNHEGDNIWSVSRAGMVRRMSSYPHCLIESGVKELADGTEVFGNGNYVINLADASGNIYQSLYFLDGGSNMSEEDMVRYDAEFEDKSHNDYDYLKDSQIKWYLETVADINSKNGTDVSSVVYVHIPLPEYRTAYELITGESEVTTEAPASTDDGAGNRLISGQRREVICSSGHNSGFFDAAAATGCLKAVFAGHDHINDFVLMYKDIILGYNTPGGYSSYNLYTKNISERLLQGYSVYTFNADGTLDIGSRCNADIYPDEQDDVRSLY